MTPIPTSQNTRTGRIPKPQGTVSFIGWTAGRHYYNFDGTAENAGGRRQNPDTPGSVPNGRR